MNTAKETLTFKRMATKAKDGANGFLYVHTFHNGFQEIIFDSKEAADRVRKSFGTTKYEKHLKTPA